MRPMILSLLALAFAARLAVADGASDAKWKEAEQAYKDDFKKKSIRFKKRAIEALPPNDPRTISFIIDKEKLLSSKDWWIRITAAEQLAKIKVPELREKLLSYSKSSDVKVREGIMAALAISADRLDPPAIIEGLQDKAWQVRRMACWAAGQQRVKEAVDQMISMINWVDPRDGRVLQEGEPHPRVHSVLLFNLEEITGKYFHTDVDQWKQYWERNKDKSLPRVKRFDVADFGDVKSMEFNDTFARKGSGPLVIVLPIPQHVTTYYMPYFNQWMFVKWFFVNLPPIKSFPDVQYNEHGDPIYPVDILVDAFEEIRKQNHAEKLILLGHWFSTWVAAKYAQKYPDRVEGLILLNPYASNDGFSKAIDGAKRSGDPDQEFWGKVSSYELRMASRIEGEVYKYVETTYFLAPKNRDDIEAGVLKSIWTDTREGSIAIPPFDIRGEETSRAPCLIYTAGKENELEGFDDISRLQRYYTKHVVVKGGKDFGYFPFMEDPEEFEKGLRIFIDKKIQ